MAVWQGFQQTTVDFFAPRGMGIILGLGLAAIAPHFAVAMPHEMAGESLHFYGTTTQADQLGHDYMILQFIDGDHVEGSVYQVNSEFACFSGELAEGKLNLAIVDPYEQIAYDYQLNYQGSLPIAAVGDRLTTEFVPEGYVAISNPSDLAMEVLTNCVNQG